MGTIQIKPKEGKESKRANLFQHLQTALLVCLITSYELKNACPSLSYRLSTTYISKLKEKTHKLNYYIYISKP